MADTIAAFNWQKSDFSGHIRDGCSCVQGLYCSHVVVPLYGDLLEHLQNFLQFFLQFICTHNPIETGLKFKTQQFPFKGQNPKPQRYHPK